MLSKVIRPSHLLLLSPADDRLFRVGARHTEHLQLLLLLLLSSPGGKSAEERAAEQKRRRAEVPSGQSKGADGSLKRDD